MAKNAYRKIVSVGLDSKDWQALSELSKKKKKTMSETIRAAVRYYLANEDAIDLELTDRMYVAELRELAKSITETNSKNTDRVCKMLSRLMLETGVVYQCAYNETDETLFEQMVQLTRDRIYKRLKKDEDALAAQMQKVVQQ